MPNCTRMCRFLFVIMLWLPFGLSAAPAVKAMVIFGDSLSDTGNTTHLLKALRQDEHPAFLVKPLKVFVINKMTEFANDYYVPQVVLDSGIDLVTHFFDEDLAPLLANLIGKVRQVPVLPGDPYWQHHFSNGRIWSEYLAPMLNVDREDLRVFDDQAFGGSWAVSYDYQLTVWNLIRHPINTLKTLVVGKLIPPSLGLTIQSYLLVHEHLDSQTIYFVFSGANDYVNVLKFEDNYNPAVMNSYIDNVLDGLGSGVKKLVSAGATHIVVIGLPEIGHIPKFNRTYDRPVLNNAIQQHNERLALRVEEWRLIMPQVDFLFIPVQSYFEKALNNPEQFGINNTMDACIDIKLPMFHTLAGSPFAGNYVLEYLQVLHYRDSNFAASDKNYHVCDNPDAYLFWDELHPTTRVHRYLAYEICEAMKEHGYRTQCQTPTNL
ncbi:phospholipase [Legionella quinlivanii]|uniref:Phospholipase n=1 Tax=Legionella quinlivanii TaxID=45073 RepID=A0A364LJU3_9GAMM|nr:SGNH/GDSL hydrolase family protein [Legionella quinlivanii]RAP36792.1 phospholipase [Legionella quinlivanii]